MSLYEFRAKYNPNLNEETKEGQYSHGVVSDPAEDIKTMAWTLKLLRR